MTILILNNKIKISYANLKYVLYENNNFLSILLIDLNLQCDMISLHNKVFP